MGTGEIRGYLFREFLCLKEEEEASLSLRTDRQSGVTTTPLSKGRRTPRETTPRATLLWTRERDEATVFIGGTPPPLAHCRLALHFRGVSTAPPPVCGRSRSSLASVFQESLHSRFFSSPAKPKPPHPLPICSHFIRIFPICVCLSVPFSDISHLLLLMLEEVWPGRRHNFLNV